jgi:hypothetical protein
MNLVVIIVAALSSSLALIAYRLRQIVPFLAMYLFVPAGCFRWEPHLVSLICLRVGIVSLQSKRTVRSIRLAYEKAKRR